MFVGVEPVDVDRVAPATSVANWSAAAALMPGIRCAPDEPIEQLAE